MIFNVTIVSIDAGCPRIISEQSPNQSHLKTNILPSFELQSTNLSFFIIFYKLNKIFIIFIFLP
jgi:hypothetical protein